MPHWDEALGFGLVLLIRWKCFYRDVPESFSLNRIDYLSNSPDRDFRLVANFNMRIGLQIMIPLRMLRRATLRGHEDIVVSIHDSHQRGLADRTGVPPAMGHDDDRQVGGAVLGELGRAQEGRLGAEGAGIRRLVKQSCDQVARIPIGGTVESLNVSVSAALCLYETVRQRAT